MDKKNITPFFTTFAEGEVLASVSLLDGTHDRPRLLQHILFMDSARETSFLSAALAEEALDACLVKDWIKVLTPEDCLRDKTRWVEEPNQAVSESEYREGNIDFTDAGAQLWNRLQREEATTSGKRVQGGILCYAWRFDGQVRIFSAYEDELRDQVEAIRAGKNVPYTGECHVERIEGPFVLRDWWINRFVRLTQGYRMDIYYTCDDEEE